MLTLLRQLTVSIHNSVALPRITTNNVDISHMDKRWEEKNDEARVVE